MLISKILLPSLFHPVYNFVQSSNDFIFSTSQFETMSRSLGHIFQNICEILVLTVKTKALLNQFWLALYGQARSSIPRNMSLMNSSFESLNPWCIDATSIKFKYTFLHSWLAVNFYNNISVFVQIQISFNGQNCFEDIHNKFKETEPVEIS